MINSDSSELKQVVRGNIPPNAYFSEEEHVPMFIGACPRHITKAMLRAMLNATIGSPIPPCYFGWNIHRLCNTSSSVR